MQAEPGRVVRIEMYGRIMSLAPGLSGPVSGASIYHSAKRNKFRPIPATRFRDYWLPGLAFRRDRCERRSESVEGQDGRASLDSQPTL